ncbi:MAG: shikimate kinase [Clostridia bacterium]|nr:shikimate kinase [Clostridia bacterium]
MGKNVTLIGMPSVGKSTVGKILAERTGRRFIDTDFLLVYRYGASLSSLIGAWGTEQFIAAESRLLSELKAENAVISTGGSAVYGDAGMQRLQEISTVIYLEADVAALRRRLGNMQKRGVVARNADTLEQLFDERLPLYRRWANLTVPIGNSPASTAERVMAALAESENAL